jgi:PAS domain S-box-containing protein
MEFKRLTNTTLLFSIAIIVLTTILAIFYFNTQHVKATNDLVEHTQEVLRKSDDFLLDVVDIETSARGYVFTGNESFLQPFNRAALTINDNLSTLKRLTKNKPSQQLRIDSMIQTSITRRVSIDKILAAKKNNQLSESEKRDFITEGLVITGKIKERVAAFNSEEFALLKQRKLESDKSNRNMEWSFIGLLFSIITLAALVAFALRNQRHKIENAIELEQKVTERTAQLSDVNDLLQQKNQEIALSKYNKMFLTEFSEKFSGNNFNHEFFNTLVQFLVDITNLDYAFVAKFKDDNTNKSTLETIAISTNGSIAKNFDYSLIDGPCGEIVYGNLYTYVENCKTTFPKGQLITAYDVDGYIGFPLQNTEGVAIGLVAVMHKGKIENLENITSILKIVAKRAEMEMERLKNEQKLSDNNAQLKQNNKALEYNNLLLIQKNIEVEESREKLLSEYSRSLIEASLDPLVTISTEGKIMDMNVAMMNITDKNRGQLIGTDFKEYFTDAVKAHEVYQEVFAKGYVTDYPLTIKDGILTHVLFNGSVYKDEEGTVLGAVVVARNVTQQKLLENALIEYKHFFNQSTDFACIANMEGYYEVVNDSFERVLGFSDDVLLKNKFIELVHPDDKEATLMEMKQLHDSTRTVNFINRYRKKDGSYVWFDWNSSFSPATQKIYAIARDITEQKRVQENLELSLKEVSDYKYALDASSIVEVTDAHGVIKYVNDNFCKLSQYTPEEIVGNNHRMINSGFHSKEMMRDMWATISSGKIWKNDLKNVAKDGTHYWLATTIVPFLDEHGIPYQYVAIRTDITEQKRVATELLDAKLKAEDAQSKAEIAMKSKQQFLSNMSHEIRTPLNGIIGFTKVILKTDLSAKQKEYLTAIKMSGDTLIVLINDILDLAKVDAGKMTFEQTPFKIAYSISSMMHLFEAKIQEKNLVLVKEYDSKIPTVLVGDPVRLHQIILNLVSNAIKFTTKGRITISVRLLKEEAENVTIEFAVADTGIGISTEKIENIFENFHQAHSNTTRLYGGTGLGLAIVKQLVESQGGTIQVKSTLNEGSIFSFTLNFLKTDAEAEVVTEILELDKDIKNIKVLVVEDMPLNQLLMKTILDDFGFERDIADNGLIAIEKLKEKSYDVVLMDLQMPEMNGFEATEYIRKTLKSKIPIIALTADVTTVDLEKCRAVGMNDYIAKPVDETLLYSKIVGFVKKPMQAPIKIINGVAQTAKLRYTNMEYLSKITKSNPTLMMEMIEAYLDQTPSLITEMKQSFHNEDWDVFHAAVHKMVPSFSIMGISPDFENMAKKAMEHARVQEETHNIFDFVMQLEAVCLQACEELREEFNVLNKNKIAV